MAVWTKISLWKRVLGGMVLGLLVGLLLRIGLGAEAGTQIAKTWLYPFGDAFVRLIRMLVIPLIFTTLVAGVIAMGDPKRLGSLGGRALALYLITTSFAVTLGLIMGTIFQPGKGINTDNVESSDISAIEDKLQIADASGSLIDRIVAIIPQNPIQAMAGTDVLGVIFFAILFGVGCLLARDAGKAVSDAIESAAEVMLKLTMLVMETAPIGVFALMSWVIADKGLGVLINLGLLAAALYLTCVLHIIIVYGGIVKFILRLPIIRFFRGIADAQAVAYSVSSSSATLPVTISCATKNLGIERSVAGSVLPLGATINMDGTAAYLGIIALFAAQSLGIEVSLVQYVMVAITASLASIGAAGITSAGLLLAATVLSVIGVSDAEALLIIALIFPFDRLLDMMRTLTNITGDSAIALTVAKWEGALDEEIYYRDNAF